MFINILIDFSNLAEVIFNIMVWIALSFEFELTKKIKTFPEFDNNKFYNLIVKTILTLFIKKVFIHYSTII